MWVFGSWAAFFFSVVAALLAARYSTTANEGVQKGTSRRQTLPEWVRLFSRVLGWIMNFVIVYWVASK